MKTPKMKLLSLLGLVIASISLTACNTVKGAGQDIEAAGDSIENTASENTPY